MSRHAWITPDDAPGAAECRPVFVPAGRTFEAAFRGAFLLLCDPENWEAHGTQTPEDIAAAFEAAFFQTVDNWEGSCVVHYVGEVFVFGGSSDPPGCLKCEGQFLLRADYAELFAVIGDTFGFSDPSDFRLPDLRGRVPIGVTAGGNGLGPYAMGDIGGVEKHGLILEEMPEHRHTVGRLNVAGGASTALDWRTDVTSVAQVGTTYVGSGLAHENRPPFQALQFYIQAE